MMYVENFVGRCKFISWTCQNFVGMCMDKFMGLEIFCGYGRILMGMKFWLWKSFVGYVMFDHDKTFMVIVLDM